MPENAKITSPALGDVKAIYKIIKDNADMLITRPMSDIAQNIDRFLVAKDAEGALAGVIAYDFLPEIGDPLRTAVELQSVCVRDGWRGRGVGKALVEAQIARLAPFGPHQYIVLTFSVGFFEKLGFRVTPKTALMHKLYMGCLNCAKHESPFTCPEQAMVRPAALA